MADSKASTILIVDDDQAVIEQLVTHFRRRNYEPIATADPTIVEQTLNTFKVDLILLDLRMERLNGYDVLKKIRGRKLDIAILIITAYYKDEKERLKEVGITQEDVIEKPFRDFAKVEAQINKKLNKVVIPGEYYSDYENEIYLNNRTKMVLVDDEEEMIDMLKETLEPRNYDVHVFTKGDQALSYILNNECHIAIVDMKIPGLGGEEIIQKALQAKPDLKVIPFSGAYTKDMKEALSKVGFDPNKLVTKPFDIPILVEKIKVLATEVGTLG